MKKLTNSLDPTNLVLWSALALEEAMRHTSSLHPFYRVPLWWLCRLLQMAVYLASFVFYVCCVVWFLGLIYTAFHWAMSLFRSDL